MTLTELDRIIREHQGEVYRYLRYLGADGSTAEDLAQDTFLAASGSPTEIAGWHSGRRAAWLRGIARNKWLAEHRRMRASPVSADSQTLERYAQDAESVWTREFLGGGDGFEYQEALRKCLDLLPAPRREALRLRYEQNKSREEMAAALQLSEDGIKSLLRRIRSALGDCVLRRLGRPGEPLKEVPDANA